MTSIQSAEMTYLARDIVRQKRRASNSSGVNRRRSTPMQKFKISLIQATFCTAHLHYRKLVSDNKGSIVKKTFGNEYKDGKVITISAMGRTVKIAKSLVVKQQLDAIAMT